MTETGTVNVTVTNTDDGATISGDLTGSADEDNAPTGTLSGTDVDGLADGTLWTISSNGTNGSATIDPATGAWSYTPNADFNGSDSFEVTLTDDQGGTTTQTVTVTINAIADVVDDTLTVAEGSSVQANVITGTNGASADNFEGTATLTDVTNGTNGTVTLDDATGTLTYTPTGDFVGTDSFTYTVTSGGVTETGTVSVLVVDETPPVVGPLDITMETDSGNDDYLTSNNHPELTFTGEPGMEILIKGPDGELLDSSQYEVVEEPEGTYTVVFVDADPDEEGEQPFGDYANGEATENDVNTGDGVYTLIGVDESGNESELEPFVIDTHAPGQSDEDIPLGPVDIQDSSDTGENELLTQDNNPVLEFTGEPGLEIELIGPDGTPLDPDQYIVEEIPGENEGDPSTYIVSLADADPSTEGDDPFGDYAEGDATENGAREGDGEYRIMARDEAGNETEVDRFEIRTGPCDEGLDAPQCDRDNDGLTNAEELELGTDPENPDSDGDGYCDGSRGVADLCVGGEDLDDDGQIETGESDPLDPCDPDRDAPNCDRDGDGLTNQEEEQLGSSPVDPDSDGDGLLDSEDLSTAGAPLDACIPNPNADACDRDGDGIPNREDTCPDDADPTDLDKDGDGVGDVCDPDADGSGIDDDYLLYGGGLGGGCNAVRGNGTSILGLLALLLIGRRRKRGGHRQKLLPAVGAMVAIAFFAISAVAQNRFDVPVERLRPAINEEGILDVESGKVGEHMDWDAAMWVGYALNPLVAYKPDDEGAFQRAGALVSHRIAANLVASLSLYDWISVGVDLPTTLMQIGNNFEGVSGIPTFRAGIGDLRLVPKFNLMRAEDFGVDVSIVPALTVPTAMPDNSFLGDGNYTFVPELAVSRDFDRGIRVAGNLGMKLREAQDLENIQVGQELGYRVGAAYDLREYDASLPIELVASASGGVVVQPLASGLYDASAELNAGINWFPNPATTVFVAAGAGMLPGLGSPDARIFAGVRFLERRRDSDGDGFDDRDDDCPNDAEDVDQFQDEDGCPDPDNDQDGVLDVDDQCIMTPGVAEFAGCADTDGDGIQDSEDKCPDVPGIAAFTGCPDTDGDGIQDSEDKCPNEAEDFDSFEDEDGCPEADNDNDGVLDAADQCPTEPETPNGFADEDGCADEAPTMVNITDAKLEILEKVYFDTAKATLQTRSYPLLDEVARVLDVRKDMKLITVEGHTDSMGNDDYNLNLSQARAQTVLEYLVSKGIERSRLQAKGYGETKSVQSNQTATGREANRRVEFTITELEKKAE